MSKKRALSSRKLTTASLKLAKFLKEAPLKYSSELHKGEKNEILEECYNSLWDANGSWMREYFSKDNSHECNSNEEPNPFQAGKPCGHIFKKGESIYRCRNCGLDGTCVLCSKCFQSTEHEGHDITIQISKKSGGCCDCGDAEAWKVPLFCKIHSIDPTKEDLKKPIASVPPQLLQSVRDTITTIFDYILDTFATSPENISAVPTSKEIRSECNASHKALDLPGITSDQMYVCILWNDEDHSFDDVISIIKHAFDSTDTEARHSAECVDQYGRCIIGHSKNLRYLIGGAKKINSIGLAVSISSVQKVLREDIAGLLLKWVNELVTENSFFFGDIQDGNCIIQDIIHDVLFQDWSLRPKLARLSVQQRIKKPISKAEVINISEDESSVVGNDQTDSQNTISLLTESESEDDTMDNIQALVYQAGVEGSSTSQSEDDDLWDLTDTYIPPNTTQERNTFNQDIDMLFGRISGTTRSSDALKKRKLSYPSLNKKNTFDIGDIDWELDYWLYRTENMDKSENLRLTTTESQFAALSECSRSIDDIMLSDEFRRKLRLDYLLLYDLRLWKTARDDIKDLYISTFTSSSKYRTEFGKRFARNYPDIINAYLFKDREVEYSISRLSVQLLTTPTVSSVLMTNYRFFGMILAITTNYFIEYETSVKVSDHYNQVQIDCSSKAASSVESYRLLFQNLRFVMDIKQNRLAFATTPLYLSQFVDFISHFQGMDPLRRKINVHVEYESDSWTNAFNLNENIGKMCRLFATSFYSLDNEMPMVQAAHHFSRTVRRVLRTILQWDPRVLTIDGVKESARLVKGVEHHHYSNVLSHSAGLFQVVDYNVAVSPVSFHHPLHWLLSHLLENTKFLQDDVLHQIGWTGGLDQLIQSTFDSQKPNQFLGIVEYSIRTLALLAQISCGNWVRNGRNVVIQMHNYQDISFRPNTLDCDIHLLQVGFTLCDRNHILLTLIDRFQLLDWFSGSPHTTHNVYDDAQKKHMVEELLNLLIIVATEYDKLSGASPEQKIRRFIIQYLALSDLTYSELLKMIPSKLNDGSFETYLNEMAIFKPPTGLDDRGLYELKPEYMNQLDPYFWHYSRNQREEAQEVMKGYHNRVNPNQSLKESDEFLFVPQLTQSNLGPFKDVNSFLHSHVFCEMMTYSLLNYRDGKDDSNDTILDQTLHLAILAAIDSERKGLKQDQGTQETLASSQWLSAPTFIDNAVNDVIPESQNTNLLSIILSYLSDNGRLSHTHKRMHFLLEKFASLGSSDTKELIQRWEQNNSRLNKAATSSNDGSDMSEYERKKAAAKARQAAIMSQMANAQAQFMENHADMYDEFEEGEEKDDPMEVCDDHDYLGDPYAQVVRMCHFSTESCIVCQEQLNDSQLFGVLAYVQNSGIQRITPSNNKDVWTDILNASQGTDPWQDNNTEEYPFKSFPTEAHIKGMEISSCNHMMHADCFSTYQDAVEAQLFAETLRGDGQTFFNGRYLCPLCKSLGNTLIPLIWRGKMESYPGVSVPRSSFSELKSNALHLRTELNLMIEETTKSEYNSASFKNRDPNIFLNNPDMLKLLYNQLNLTIAKTQLVISDDSHLDGSDLSLIDSLKCLYNIYILTLSKLEIAQRGGLGTKARDPTVEYTSTLMDDIPTTTQTFLKILGMTNDFLPILLSSPWDSDEMLVKERLALDALKKVFPSDFNIFDRVHPLLLEDPFEMVVVLGFSTKEYPQLEPHHILRSMYIAELTKTVIGIYLSMVHGQDTWNDISITNGVRELTMSQRDPTNEEPLIGFVYYVLSLLNVQTESLDTFFQTIHPSALLSILRTFTLPFLRKSLLFMVVFHGFILQTPEDNVSQMSEYDHLLKILGLPSPKDVFEFQKTENDLIPGWCHHLVVFSTIPGTSNTVALRPLNLFLPIQHKLVTLPYRLDALFEESLKRLCLKCNTVPENSAICLICGQFVCARRFCCTEDERGECNIHMRTCGGDIGMYLVIKDCFILLLHRDGGGTVMGAPYLDSHGEPDLFLKRGTPQYLNTKRYDQLQQMWANQTVATYVQRCMDTASASVNASWEYF